MNRVIKVRRGLKATLPASVPAKEGELKYAKDTKELFIDDSTGNVKLAEEFPTTEGVFGIKVGPTGESEYYDMKDDFVPQPLVDLQDVYHIFLNKKLTPLVKSTHTAHVDSSFTATVSDGSTIAPYKSITAALEAVKYDDTNPIETTIKISDGLYAENIAFLGTAAASNVQKYRTLVGAQNTRIDSIAITEEADFITLKNLIISGSLSILSDTTGTNHTVIDCHIEGGTRVSKGESVYFQNCRFGGSVLIENEATVLFEGCVFDAGVAFLAVSGNSRVLTRYCLNIAVDIRASVFYAFNGCTFIADDTNAGIISDPLTKVVYITDGLVHKSNGTLGTINLAVPTISATIFLGLLQYDSDHSTVPVSDPFAGITTKQVHDTATRLGYTTAGVTLSEHLDGIAATLHNLQNFIIAKDYTFLVDSNQKLEDWCNGVLGNDYEVVKIASGEFSAHKTLDLSDGRTKKIFGAEGAAISLDITTNPLLVFVLKGTPHLEIKNVTIKATFWGDQRGIDTAKSIDHCTLNLTHLWRNGDPGLGVTNVLSLRDSTVKGTFNWGVLYQTLNDDNFFEIARSNFELIIDGNGASGISYAIKQEGIKGTSRTTVNDSIIHIGSLNVNPVWVIGAYNVIATSSQILPIGNDTTAPVGFVYSKAVNCYVKLNGTILLPINAGTLIDPDLVPSSGFFGCSGTHNTVLLNDQGKGFLKCEHLSNNVAHATQEAFADSYAGDYGTSPIANNTSQGGYNMGGVTTPTVPGSPGLYTWVKYSDHADGANMYDVPTASTLYIGIAVNKPTVTKSDNPADYSWTLFKGNDGTEGVPGATGPNGETLYTWIRYSDNPDGSNMYAVPTASTLYIGIAANKPIQTPSANPADYAWMQFQGSSGSNGVPGATTYTWISYSDNSDGSSMYDVPTPSTEYIGIAVNKLTPTKSTDPLDYTWTQFKGNNGNNGIPGATGPNGETLYTWIRYADDALGSGISEDATGKAYIGFAYNKPSQTPSTDPLDYTWTLISTSGVDGAPGQSLYTWVKYANSATGAGISDAPDGKSYIGFAYNKPTATESNNPADYEWSLLNSGSTGIPGGTGPNGEQLYTWVRYADDAQGNGISVDPTGKSYIGFAYNKPSAIESNDPTDYAWVPLNSTGSGVADGQTLYTWIRYSDNPDGSGMYDIPTQNTLYIGIAVNKPTETPSTNKADYSWTLIKGSDGVPGSSGGDGQTLYTWIRYADDAAGLNMSDDPAGKAYIGFSYNNTVQTPGTDPTAYTWSLFNNGGLDSWVPIDVASGGTGETTVTDVRRSFDIQRRYTFMVRNQDDFIALATGASGNDYTAVGVEPGSYSRNGSISLPNTVLLEGIKGGVELTLTNTGDTNPFFTGNTNLVMRGFTINVQETQVTRTIGFTTLAALENIRMQFTDSRASGTAVLRLFKDVSYVRDVIVNIGGMTRNFIGFTDSKVVQGVSVKLSPSANCTATGFIGDTVVGTIHHATVDARPLATGQLVGFNNVKVYNGKVEFLTTNATSIHGCLNCKRVRDTEIIITGGSQSPVIGVKGATSVVGTTATVTQAFTLGAGFSDCFNASYNNGAGSDVPFTNCYVGTTNTSMTVGDNLGGMYNVGATGGGSGSAPTAVENIEFNPATFTWTVTYTNGQAPVTFVTPAEEFLSSANYDHSTFILYLTMSSGTIIPVDMQELVQGAIPGVVPNGGLELTADNKLKISDEFVAAMTRVPYQKSITLDRWNWIGEEPLFSYTVHDDKIYNGCLFDSWPVSRDARAAIMYAKFDENITVEDGKFTITCQHQPLADIDIIYTALI
jgi:hypothetical protein